MDRAFVLANTTLFLTMWPLIRWVIRSPPTSSSIGGTTLKHRKLIYQVIYSNKKSLTNQFWCHL